MIPETIRAQLTSAGYHTASAEPTALRGNHSDTFRITHPDGTAILKIYNEKAGGPAAKWQRERLSLRMLAGRCRVPRILIDTEPDWLLMECCPGFTLHSIWEECDPAARGRICEDIGRCYAALLGAPQDASVHDRVRGTRSYAFPDSARATLEAIDALCEIEPLVRRPVYRAARDWINRHRQPLIDATPLLTKLDFNPSNVLVDRGRVTGIIDWEEAIIGNRWIHLGIVLDHSHWFDWRSVRLGLESVTGPWTGEDEDRIFAGAMLCMWRKILHMFPGPTAWFGDGTRIENRMRAIAAAMGREEALDRRL